MTDGKEVGKTCACSCSWGNFKHGFLRKKVPPHRKLEERLHSDASKDHTNHSSKKINSMAF